MNLNRQNGHPQRQLMASFRSRRRTQTSMALIITLAMISLIAVLVVVFLLHTAFNQTIEASRINRSQADIQMQSATDYIVNRFLSEISANSTAYTSNNVSLYIPNYNTNMVPARIISSSITSIPASTNFFNLLRQSISTADPNASSISTATADSVGRTVGTNIWNMPQLNVYPGFTSAAQLPNWIYLTLANGVSSTAGSGTVGRFAYNVYDAGGLLDANVVGYTNAVSQQALVQYTEAGVNLTNVASGITQADVNKLVAFRNPGVTASNFTNYIANAANDGFLLTTTSSTNSTTGVVAPTGFTNNYFTGRQDLIRYAQIQNPDLTNALPYFTTFSRALNQPSYFPNPGRALVSSTYSDANPFTVGNDNAFNPNLLDLRDSTGQPLIKERFPLSRLAWITDSGPNPNTPTVQANILKYFGLVWDSTNHQWDYTSPEGSLSSPIPVNTIKQLANVTRSSGPDFFELLQASILTGSLGQDVGADTTTLPTEQYQSFGAANGIGTDNQGIDQNPYYHVLQIGANIIDQYKSNGYPTALVMQTPTGGLTHAVYGANNLPTISRIIAPLLWHGSTSPYPVDAYLEFEVWNPNQWNKTSFAPGPAQFRIRALSPSMIYYHTWQTAAQPAQDLGLATPIQFKVRSTSYPSGLLVNTPILLASGTYVSGMTPVTGYWSGGTQKLFGLYAGSFTLLRDQWNSIYTFVGPITIVMEYLDASSQWRIYHQIENLHWSGYIQDGLCDSSGNAGSFPCIINGEIIVDPRTERFGEHGRLTEPPGNYGYGTGTSPNQTLRYGAGIGTPSGNSWGENCYLPANAAFSLQPQPAGEVGGFSLVGTYLESISDNVHAFSGSPVSTYGSLNYYCDPDGVYRPAAGAYQTDDTDTNGRPMYVPTPSSLPVLSRSIILNRAFNAVGELGYTYRDMPWKDLDFFTPLSGDAALLDTFSMEDTTAQVSAGGVPLVAGKVNLNSRNAGTLKALLTGVPKDLGATTNSTASWLSPAEAATIANTLIARTSSTAAGSGPLTSRADLVLKFSADLTNGASYSSPSDSIIKAHRETAIRALADIGDTRTWNLLIDVVVQVGTVPTGGSFVVQGQKHCWLHVAIDRYTGKVIDRYLESVYE